VEIFAPAVRELGAAKLGPLGVAVHPTAGQGLALNELGQVPSSAIVLAVAQEAVATSETRASASYGDLATVGPDITGLADGVYLFMYGCLNKVSAGATLNFYSPKINSTEADDADAAQSDSATAFQTSIFAVVKTLSNGGNNTVTMRYRNDNAAVTSTFKNRWLIAIRVASA
jgi:hypothetical protein